MVQHIDKDFAVISLHDTAQLTVIQTRSHLNEIFLSESNKLKPGMSLSVNVIEASCQELQGLPLVSWQRSAPKRQRTTSENQKGHQFGDIVQGKVKTVKPTSIQVTLEDGSTASVHVSEVKEATGMIVGSFPTSSVKVGSVVTARVIGGREASSHKYIFWFYMLDETLCINGCSCFCHVVFILFLIIKPVWMKKEKCEDFNVFFWWTFQIPALLPSQIHIQHPWAHTYTQVTVQSRSLYIVNIVNIVIVHKT